MRPNISLQNHPNPVLNKDAKRENDKRYNLPFKIVEAFNRTQKEGRKFERKHLEGAARRTATKIRKRSDKKAQDKNRQVKEINKYYGRFPI